MRFLSLAFITLAAGIAVAADGVHAVTYLEGNVEGLTQNETGTLQFRDSKAMVLHGKGADVPVAYAAVTKTDRKTVPVLTEKDPLYKVWTIHKRLLIPTPPEQLTVHYTDRAGVAKTITMEMDNEAADRLQAQVKQSVDKAAADQGSWWGDSIWKTARNKDQWAGVDVVASRE